MGRDYIPEKDTDAVGWLMRFAQRLASVPNLYHVAPEAAAEVLAATTAFQAALAVTTRAATRTSVTIITKNEKRKAAEQLVRRYAGQIKADADIDSGLKRALGIHPPRQRKRRVPAPQETPRLVPLRAASLRQEVRFFRQTELGNRRIRKPYGAAQLQLYMTVADGPVCDPERAQFYRAFSANPAQVTFTKADDGKVATYYARWASARGETGPWSQPLTMRII